MSQILLVDDDDGLRKVLRITLERMGHQVTEARNGKEALTAYEQVAPDLIITDLIMPEMEGIETIMRLKKSHPDAKIIAMSGGGRVKATNFLVAAEELGAATTLAKPFTSDQLARAIQETLAPAT